jgi:hemerythrin-like metal-binding protein
MSRYIPWTRKLELGLPEIDEQHKTIINLMNLLAKAIEAHKETKAVHYALMEMMDYSIRHFKAEEEHMALYDFPGIEEHKKEHNLFVQKVQSFISQEQDGRVGLAVDALDFLSNWWTEHILNTDSQYADHEKTARKKNQSSESES